MAAKTPTVYVCVHSVYTVCILCTPCTVYCTEENTRIRFVWSLNLSTGKHIHEQTLEKSTYSESWTEARFRGERFVER
jgi:Fe-S-cluster-containing dehydrogenase component